MFLSCKKIQTCKKTFNFKREVQKHIFEQKKQWGTQRILFPLE
jgi:hypothetical protein